MVYDYSKFKSLELNDEEVNAIRRYMSIFHISLNSVLDVDPKVILELRDKGWLINLSKETVAENISVLEKIYSAMYKQSKIAPQNSNTFYRGTSINEVEMLKAGKQYSRFLSTSQDKEISKRFSEYNNAAILNMDQYLDETAISEKEILIAPYSKITNIRKRDYSNDSVFTEYDIDIEKQEYNKLNEKEREKCEKEIYSFDIDKYDKLEQDVEMLYKDKKLFENGMLKGDFEEYEALKKKIEDKSSKLETTLDRFKLLRDNMSKYLQDKFKNIEIEIDKQIQKEEKEQDEKYRINRIQEIKKLKEELIQKADERVELVNDVREKYSKLDDEELELNETAKNSGNINVSDRNIEKSNVSKFEEVINNIN